MNSAFKGVLFDKDGTLIDFERTWTPAYRRAARYVAELQNRHELEDRLLFDGGLEPDTGRWRCGSLLSSGSNEEIIDRWCDIAGIDDPAEIRDSVLEIFFTSATESPVSLDGAQDCLQTLHGRNMTLGIATMDDERTALNSMQTLAFTPMLAFICGADSGFGTKPGTGMFEAFCRQSDLDPAQVVMIGDSPHDLNMGRTANAGLVVGVTSGTHGKADLAPLADHVLGSVAELPDLLDV